MIKFRVSIYYLFFGLFFLIDFGLGLRKQKAYIGGDTSSAKAMSRPAHGCPNIAPSLLFSFATVSTQTWLLIVHLGLVLLLGLALRKEQSPKLQGHCSCKRHANASAALPQHCSLHTLVLGTSLTCMWLLLLCLQLGLRLGLGWRKPQCF